MGNMHYTEPQRRPETMHAVDALIEHITAHAPVTLVTLGPLTNVALALQKHPGIVSHVERCVVMGGAACTVGNITPAAEYNIWVDPEAARVVFHSGLPIEMVGWELCRGDANLDADEIDTLRGFGTPFAQFTVDCNRVLIDSVRRQSSDRGLGLPDPVAMSIALDPTICLRRSRHHVDIETVSDLTRGATVVDLLGVAREPQNCTTWSRVTQREPKVSVCWAIDVRRWKEALFRAVRTSRLEAPP
jgi:purine nucleosidase